jgi:hypothetical protein
MLREAGIMNMMESPSYLETTFNLSRREAEKIAIEWMQNCSAIADALEGKKKKKVDDDIFSDDEDEEKDDSKEKNDSKSSEKGSENSTENSTENSSEDSPTEYDTLWDDLHQYKPNDRVVFKKNVYEAQRNTNAHPTSKNDWTRLSKDVAIVRKIHKVKKTIEKKKRQRQPSTNTKKRTNAMEELLARLEKICERVEKM